MKLPTTVSTFFGPPYNMALEWTEWRKKLVAVSYPDTASLNDAQAVMNLLFRPTPQRKKLITWVSRRIVECIEGLRCSDLPSIFSNFVYGSKETFEAFIKAELGRNKTENIWISILDDLKLRRSPRRALHCAGDARFEILFSGITTLSTEQLELLGIAGSPQQDSSHSPDIFDEVDDVIKRAEASLTKPLPVFPSTLPTSPKKIIRPLAKLKEEAKKLNNEIQSDSSVEEGVKRNETEIIQIRTAAADFEEFVDELRTLKVAVKKMDDIKKCDGESAY